MKSYSNADTYVSLENVRRVDKILYPAQEEYYIRIEYTDGNIQSLIFWENGKAIRRAFSKIVKLLTEN